MTTWDKLPFVTNHVSEHTLAMLMSYRQRGFDARTFMLREHGKMLEELNAGSGRYENYTSAQRQFVECCIYVELLNKVCLLLEDFGDLCYALSGSLLDFPKRIFSQQSPIKILRDLDAKKWNTILRYADTGSLDLTEDEQAFGHEVRDRNIRQLQKLINLFADFLEYHWLFYTKHKHGNPLIYGLEKVELDGEPTMFIPAMYNSKKSDLTTGVLVNASSYAKWQKLHDAVLTMSKDLVERTLLFIERNGVPIVEHVVYARMTAEEKNRLKIINERCNELVNQVNISIEWGLYT